MSTPVYRTEPYPHPPTMAWALWQSRFGHRISETGSHAEGPCGLKPQVDHGNGRSARAAQPRPGSRAGRAGSSRGERSLFRPGQRVSSSRISTIASPLNRPERLEGRHQCICHGVQYVQLGLQFGLQMMAAWRTSAAIRTRQMSSSLLTGEVSSVAHRARPVEPRS